MDGTWQNNNPNSPSLGVTATHGSSTTEWQTASYLPGNLDPELLDMEYEKSTSKKQPPAPEQAM